MSSFVLRALLVVVQQPQKKSFRTIEPLSKKALRGKQHSKVAHYLAKSAPMSTLNRFLLAKQHPFLLAQR
jgi:hypothetical protein